MVADPRPSRPSSRPNLHFSRHCPYRPSQTSYRGRKEQPHSSPTCELKVTMKVYKLDALRKEFPYGSIHLVSRWEDPYSDRKKSPSSLDVVPGGKDLN